VSKKPKDGTKSCSFKKLDQGLENVLQMDQKKLNNMYVRSYLIPKVMLNKYLSKNLRNLNS